MLYIKAILSKRNVKIGNIFRDQRPLSKETDIRMRFNTPILKVEQLPISVPGLSSVICSKLRDRRITDNADKINGSRCESGPVIKVDRNG